jgi:thiosulfate reductase cytochrome b subunit
MASMLVSHAEAAEADAPAIGATGHALWVRVSHWMLTLSLLTLAFTGFMILLVHPRLYWGHAGNDLIPALIEIPIGPNARTFSWTIATPFFQDPAGPVTAGRKEEPFNQNGWARSLHFLAAWLLVLPGVVYLLLGLSGGHFRAHMWPNRADVEPQVVWRNIVDHLRLRIPPPTGGPRYGVLQKSAYTFVVFVAAPLVVLTGLTMSPAITAWMPALLTIFGGYQSARTIHFFTFVVLVLFVLVHIAMVIASGFRRQIRAMTIGD